MRSRVSSSNLHVGYRLDEGFAQKTALKVLKLLKKEGKADLEFIFVGDKAIKTFNRRYKGENRSTDVLSFRIDRRDFGHKTFLGQIIISIDAAHRNSKIFGVTLTDEIALYIIHGILHLFGYDDGDAVNSRRMSRKQDLILERLGPCKNLLKVLMPQ